MLLWLFSEILNKNRKLSHDHWNPKITIEKSGYLTYGQICDCFNEYKREIFRFVIEV